MTTVFREKPQISRLDDETRTLENKTSSQTVCKVMPEVTPSSLSKELEIPVCSENAQYVSRQHFGSEKNFGYLQDVCSTLPLNHHNNVVYNPSNTEAESLLKQTTILVLSNIQNRINMLKN